VLLTLRCGPHNLFNKIGRILLERRERCLLSLVVIMLDMLLHSDLV
jgi:hypothetical protein